MCGKMRFDSPGGGKTEKKEEQNWVWFKKKEPTCKFIYNKGGQGRKKWFAVGKHIGKACRMHGLAVVRKGRKEGATRIYGE